MSRTSSGALAPAASGADPAGRRGRLFRKYFLLILALVSGALLISGAISVYFSYQENRSALASLEHEKAVAAAARIEQFVLEIEKQIAFVALAPLGAGGIEQRRIEFYKLLRLVPAVTDIAQIGADGRELLAVSRVAMDVAGSGRDWSHEAAFEGARPGKTWYGAVYFRKQTEPYMSIAVRSGDAVTVAQVNLKFIWDVITRIRIGNQGKAYVVDASGHLVADPDIGLVLRKTDLSSLPQVKTALRGAPGMLATRAQDLGGRNVLTAYASIQPLGWKVFVEQPVAEVYAALDAAILRTAGMLVAGLLISGLAALWLARGMVRPIRILQEGAQRIGAGELDQAIDVQTGDELEALAGQFNDMSARLRESYVGLEQKVEERTRQLSDALERQTATGEILQTIARSQTDLQPVFDTIAASAMRLCDGDQGLVFSFDGALIHIGSIKAMTPEGEEATRRAFPRSPDRAGVTGRAILAGAPAQSPDVLAEHHYGLRDQAKVAGWRSAISVPLVHDGNTIGAITVTRRRPGPFAEDQMALLRTFADQALIAIENVRLFNETKEALEHQRASAEILKVVSDSVRDSQPVFDAIVASCSRLFPGYPTGLNVLNETGVVQLRASAGTDPQALARVFREVGTRYPGGGLLLRGKVSHFPDTEAPGIPEPIREACRATRTRAIVHAPLVAEGRGIGSLWIARAAPGPFSAREIALLQTFAQQAVIAIRNARLFKETEEALERQTATAEILRVISSTPTDTRPVFDALVNGGLKVFAGTGVGIAIVQGERVRIVAAGGNFGSEATKVDLPLSRESASGTAIVTATVVNVRDTEAPDAPRYVRDNGRALGFRSIAAAPMLRECEAIGAIVVTLKDPGGLSDKQLELLRTFADQAVIAIENARLFNETKEALDQQTATADILSVISSSPTDVQPVFDSIAERTAALCGAKFAFVTSFDGELIHMRATYGPHSEEHRSGYPARPGSGSIAGRVIRDGAAVQIEDVLADPDYAHKEAALRQGFLSGFGVPMIREGQVIGCIVAARPERGAAHGRLIALLQTFADQAVIAIENTRLFNETKEALDQQTATAEILKVISASPTDIQPVLKAVAENAARLCEANNAVIFRLDGELLREAASYGNLPVTSPPRAGLTVTRGTVTGRSVVDRRTIHVPDLSTEESDFPEGSAHAKSVGHRTTLATPLLREGVPVGAILIRRIENRPFSGKHIALLETFAHQAVIAIENARLFNETKEALDQQTATAEILRAISGSPADVTPVFESILENAVKLCESPTAAVFRFDGENLHLVATKNFLPEALAELKSHVPAAPSSRLISGRVILTRAIVREEDALADSGYDGPLAVLGGWRRILGVPMLREGVPIGAIVLSWPQPGPIPERQVALLTAFADQAVIAIENVRLFSEINEALRQQTSTAEVLKTISRSTFDLNTVLQTLLDNAVRLSGADRAMMLRPDAGGNYLPAVSFNYAPDSPVTAQLRERPIRPGRDSTAGRALLERRMIHIPDVLADPEYGRRDLAEAGSYRAALAMPMLRDGEAIGLITLTKKAEAGPFSDKHMEVVTTFADQAVIAIENVRLFHEIEEKSRQLEVANKHKSDFLANMSHELRTPLNAIIGFSEVLMERMFGELNEKQADYLKDIHESGRHLLSLINDILDLSKIEAGRMELELSSFDVPAALANALTLVRERAQRHGIALALEVDPRLGEFQADERKFKQILLNLLSNAVKFTLDGGKVDVAARLDGGNLEVAVRDTGVGIAPEDQEAVFEEFRQVGRDYTRKAEGTGLGLALVRRMIELHGGRIRLESAPGKGSTFTFTIPERP